MILKAASVLTPLYCLLGKTMPTGTYFVHLSYNPHHAVCHSHAGVGAIIIAPRGVNGTGNKYPRERLSCYHNTRVTLIVFKEYIVLGLIGLNQIVFEQKSITLVCYNNVFYIHNLSNQLACFSIGMLFLEIATHPPP